jgi:hypothetical protein
VAAFAVAGFIESFNMPCLEYRAVFFPDNTRYNIAHAFVLRNGEQL